MNKFVFIRFFVNHSQITMRAGRVNEFEVQIQENQVYLLPYDEAKRFCEAGQASLV